MIKAVCVWVHACFVIVSNVRMMQYGVICCVSVCVCFFLSVHHDHFSSFHTHFPLTLSMTLTVFAISGCVCYKDVTAQCVKLPTASAAFSSFSSLCCEALPQRRSVISQY